MPTPDYNKEFLLSEFGRILAIFQKNIRLSIWLAQLYPKFNTQKINDSISTILVYIINLFRTKIEKPRNSRFKYV